MIKSRSLDDLQPRVRDLARQWIANCAADGIDILIVSTYRDAQAQDAEYAKGRTLNGIVTPGPITTGVMGGASMHNWRVAIDFCPIEGAKCAWNDKAAFLRAGEIAEALGFEWGGRWSTLIDLDHIQYTGGLKLAELQAGTTVA